MRNKLISIALTLVIIFCICMMYLYRSKDYTNHTNNILQETQINEVLYYDVNTKIVYIIFNKTIGNTGYGYMSPYYASNGYPYIYNVQNNSLEEIERS